jgi:hypothetical protein
MMRKVQPSYELHVHRNGRTTDENDSAYFTKQRLYESSPNAHIAAGHEGLFVSCPYCHKSRDQTYFPGKDYKV